MITILVWGLLNAIVGGVLTVLPLPIWPFEPEQSISHYTAHVIYTLGQLPLIVLAFVGLRGGHGIQKAGRSWAARSRMPGPASGRASWSRPPVTIRRSASNA